MKQIIPFKKELLLKTKVSEITSISLEHNFKIEDDLITGNFHINGDYKMTEGSINREKFDFNLPFDIALDSRYKVDSMVVDIDNFYYEIINDDTLKVHIDLYVDGEKNIEDLSNENMSTYQEIVNDDDNRVEDDEEKEISNIESNDKNIVFQNEIGDIELTRDMKEDNKSIASNNVVNVEVGNEKIDIDNKQDFNIFENVPDSETYKTYYIYIVKEEDNIDKILDKYKITKEELALYNDIEKINLGDKLIIPSKNE